MVRRSENVKEELLSMKGKGTRKDSQEREHEREAPNDKKKKRKL